MKNMKKMLLLGIMVLAMGAASITAFAAAPAPAAGGGSTSLDELKAQRLELMKVHMADRVDAGLMTQEQADYMLKRMEQNQVVCNGTGGYGAGRMMSNGAGRMMSNGAGYGMMGGWNQ